jgi:PAS domain-containing protein
MKHEDHERLLRDSFGVPDTDIYSLVIQNLPMGFSLVDGNGIILEFNRMAEDLTGYSRMRSSASPISRLSTARKTPLHVLVCACA